MSEIKYDKKSIRPLEVEHIKKIRRNEKVDGATPKWSRNAI